MIKGLQGCMYAVPSLTEAVSWYAQVFERPACYQTENQAEFQVDGFSLLLVPQQGGSEPGTSGVTACWGVVSLDKTLAHIERIGAALIEPPSDDSSGNYRATVLDPFGNRVGLIQL